ncbi:MAG: ABC transporter permease [Ilumatobacteraceae bacterium]
MKIPMRVVFEQRGEAPKRLSAIVPLVSVAAALFFGALFLLATGYSPWDTYTNMVSDSFGSSRGLTDTLALSTVLICTGIAAAFAFQMNVYNIGGEGQLYLGMIGGAWAGIALGDHLPSLIMVPLVLAFGALGGAAWIFVPAFVRSRLGTSEIVSTLLLTYVASSLIDYVIYTPGSFFRNPNTAFPQGRLFAASAKLDPFGDTRLYPTIILAIVIAVALYWMVKRTEFGYRINVIADSPKAAHYAGISAKRTTMWVMLISGALAGLGGALLIVGPYGKIEPSIVNLGYGYAGIVIAALARNNLAAIVVSGILFSGLRVGGEKLQISTDTPIHIGVMLQGAILIFALGGEAFRRYRIRIVRVQVAT